MAAAWSLDEALADEVNLDPRVCNKLVNMIDKEQCTLPFIARQVIVALIIIINGSNNGSVAVCISSRKSSSSCCCWLAPDVVSYSLILSSFVANVCY